MPLREIEYILHFGHRHGARADPVTIGSPAGMPKAMRDVLAFDAPSRERTATAVTEHGGRPAR